MSVLVRGMEMPTSCDDCPLGGSLCCHLLRGVPALWAEYTNAVREKRRHSDCPLVPVPQHGRLIDADALTNHVVEKYNVKKVGEQKAFEMADFILFDIPNAPTIIPASEEGE